MIKRQFCYFIVLTADEYHDACFMCARGYLAGITEHASLTLSADETRDALVVLCFYESDAWKCADWDHENPYDTWALTTRRTSLGAKVAAFLDEIV